MTTSSDPFERHQITHLSPSSLRLWREAPAVWIGKHLLKVPDEGGPGAWRGHAVESGVDFILFGGSAEDAIATMYHQWDLDAQGVIDDGAAKECEALSDFLVQASVALGGKPTPLQRQAKIQLEIPGISIPLIGYSDWVWPDHGIDLKTTWRIPSAPDPAHIEQVAAYSLHHGVPFSLCYVSPKRWACYEVTKPMASEAWDRVIETAQAIKSFLAHVDSAHDALSMFAPDYTSFYWRPPMIEAVKAAKAVRVLPLRQGNQP